MRVVLVSFFFQFQMLAKSKFDPKPTVLDICIDCKATDLVSRYDWPVNGVAREVEDWTNCCRRSNLLNVFIHERSCIVLFFSKKIPMSNYEGM